METTQQAFDRLTREYQTWMQANGLKLGSAGEHLHDESLTEAQRLWLRDFSQRWERPGMRSKLEQMAKAARPIDDNDFGSERQVTAFNLFNIAASGLMTPEENDAWDAYSMKATNDEIIDEALRLALPHLA